jgi:hypothetical protein
MSESIENEVTSGLTGHLQSGTSSESVVPTFAFLVLNGGLFVTLKWDWIKLLHLVEAHLVVSFLLLFMVVMGIASHLEIFNHQLYRLFEGYWHSSFLFFDSILKNEARIERDELQARINSLGDKYLAAKKESDDSKLDESERKYCEAIYEKRHRFADLRHKYAILPTRLGNKMLAAERYPLDRYNIDSVTLWGRLVTILPEDVRGMIRASRAKVDRALNFSFLFLCSSIGWLVYASWQMVLRDHRSALFALVALAAYCLLFSLLFRMWPRTRYEQGKWICLGVVCLAFFLKHWLHGLQSLDDYIDYGVSIFFMVLGRFYYELAVFVVGGYMDKIETVYDLFRKDLLKALGYETTSVEEERHIWKKVGQGIMHGQTID